MADVLCYKVVHRVLNTWALATQKYGTREEVGMQVLLSMFRTDPETKSVFGFTAMQDVEGNALLKMGAMVHGTRVFSMLDQTLGLLGPDMETTIEFLETLGANHSRLGVKQKHFTVLSDCLREVMATILGDNFTPDDDTAWKEAMTFLSSHIIKKM